MNTVGKTICGIVLGIAGSVAVANLASAATAPYEPNPQKRTAAVEAERKESEKKFEALKKEQRKNAGFWRIYNEREKERNSGPKTKPDSDYEPLTEAERIAEATQHYNLALKFSSTEYTETVKLRKVSDNHFSYLRNGFVDALRSMRLAFSIYPGDNEPVEWKRLLVAIYNGRIKELWDKNDTIDKYTQSEIDRDREITELTRARESLEAQLN